MKRQIIGGLIGMGIAGLLALMFPSNDSPYISMIVGGAFTLIGASIGQWLDIKHEMKEYEKRWM